MLDYSCLCTAVFATGATSWRFIKLYFNCLIWLLRSLLTVSTYWYICSKEFNSWMVFLAFFSFFERLPILSSDSLLGNILLSDFSSCSNFKFKLAIFVLRRLIYCSYFSACSFNAASAVYCAACCSFTIALSCSISLTICT